MSASAEERIPSRATPSRRDGVAILERFELRREPSDSAQRRKNSSRRVGGIQVVSFPLIGCASIRNCSKERMARRSGLGRQTLPPGGQTENRLTENSLLGFPF